MVGYGPECLVRPRKKEAGRMEARAQGEAGRARALPSTRVAIFQDRTEDPRQCAKTEVI